MNSNLLTILLLLSAAVLGVAVARRLKLPSMLAYLTIGIVLGPHGLAMLSESSQVGRLAEFGVVFLMFSIGLEFSLQRLKAMRSLVFGLGTAQTAATALGTGLITCLVYGQSANAGIAVGLAVAMSSTAIVAKMLSERFELHSRSGRQTMGVLLFQDIAVVPCLILLPAIATPGGGLWVSLGWAAVQVVLLLTVLIWLGQKLMGRMFDSVAQYRSDELFILATIWIVVGLAWVTESAGLSLALGAFVGGMLVSETAYRHHVESDIRPFRDILLGLFFVTIGMLLNIEFVLGHLHLLILAVFLLVTGKALVMLLIALAIRTPLAAALRTAAQLAQGGEFGLVLIEVAHRLALVDNDVFQITLSAMLASMFVAPFLIERAARFSGDMGQGDWAHKTKVIHDISVSSFDMEHHVIVCGYGRTGERIGQFLASEKIPFLALEVDMQRIKQVRHSGFKVNFGSAERTEVLQAAGIGRAQAVVVTYPDAHSSERVVRAVRRLRPNVPLVVRAPDDKDVARLKAAGATEVISEVMEGSLLMAAETLAQCGVPMERGMQYVREARAKRYASMREFYRRSGR